MWEQLVRTAIPYLAVANTNWSKGYRYWGKPDKKNEIEVDVLAESTDKKALLIAEVKWSNKVNLSEIEKSINQKLDILGISSRYEYVVKAVFVMDKSMIKPLNGIYLFDCEDIIPILK
jgi:peptidoglycan hydrolase-like amidase